MLRHTPEVKKLEASGGTSTCSFESLHFVLLAALQYSKEAAICSQLLVSPTYTACTWLVEKAPGLQTWVGYAQMLFTLEFSQKHHVITASVNWSLLQAAGRVFAIQNIKIEKSAHEGNKRRCRAPELKMT